MGKKKSVVLMSLLTIVIVVLCALTVLPSFAIPGSIKKWNPAVNQYDLGAELGGSYYTYYYPEGVITETEFNNNLAGITDEEEKTEFVESYLPHGSLYLSKEEDMNIVDGEEVSADFTAAFNAAAAEISARYAARGYSDYRVAIVDDYAIRVEVPASDVNAAQVMSSFALTGEMTLEVGGELVEELKGKESKITDLIKKVSVKDRYDVAYAQVKFTKAGKAMLDELKDTLSSSSEATSGEANTLNVMIGDTAVLQICSDHIDGNVAKVPMAYVENIDSVKMLSILMNSVLENGGFDIEFRPLATSEIRMSETANGNNVAVILYVAVAVVMLALMVASMIKMGKFGGVNTYTNLSYLIIVGLCFAFISEGIFEITTGSILIFVIGLVLVNAINYFIYNAIKAEFESGKTVESAVKAGYNKTLGLVVDVYAVLLLAALALLIGGAGVYTMALQAIICVITGAFCNLLWGRAINYTFLSASKNKYKYFHFVREEDDDDE